MLKLQQEPVSRTVHVISIKTGVKTPCLCPGRHYCTTNIGLYAGLLWHSDSHTALLPAAAAAAAAGYHIITTQSSLRPLFTWQHNQPPGVDACSSNTWMGM
jgi:hypothetical protein